MQEAWTTLLANAGLVAIFVSLWISLEDRLSALLGTSISPLVLGLFAGVASILLMQIPLALSPGVLIDLRIVPLVLAAFFGGPMAAILSAFMAVVCRIYEGGLGLGAGAMSIVLASAVGTFAHFRRTPNGASTFELFKLGCLSGVVPLVALLLLPMGVREQVARTMSIPLAVAVFSSVLIFGLLILQHETRNDTSRRNSFYRTIFEALPDCLNAKDLEGRFLAANSATAALMGAEDAEQLIGRTDFDFYPAEVAHRFREDEQAVLADGKIALIEQQLTRPDGTTLWLSTLKAPFRNANGETIGLITQNRDVTRQKSLELMLAESQTRLTDALSNMADGLVMFDRNERLVFCNEQYRRLFSKTADVRVQGASLSDIIRASAERGEQLGTMPTNQHSPNGRPVSVLDVGTREIALSDGRWLEARTRHVRDGSLIVFSDITKTKESEALLQKLNDELKEAARTDALTGLANRRAFDETLDREFGRNIRVRQSLALLLIDVDYFKKYNDRYGHPAGDECLRRIAEVVKAACRRTADVGARYGGEELAIVLPNSDVQGAVAVAKTLLESIRALAIPHEDGVQGRVSVSIGIASCIPLRGDDPAILVAAADAALYEAKGAGRAQLSIAATPTLRAVTAAAKA